MNTAKRALDAAYGAARPQPAIAPGPVSAPACSHESMREIDDKPVQPRTQVRESSWPYREPIKIETPAKRSGLERVWSWLKKQVPAAQGKRMHLAENIALGEKRFVALVVVDGREFLIGGGASSVSLLSQWESATNSQAAEKSPFRFRESSE